MPRETCPRVRNHALQHAHVVTVRRHRAMSFSARHQSRKGGNVAIAGALLTFCAGAYWYTVQKVRKDEMDVAIERRVKG
jgi:hypothetical protein